MFGKKIPLKQTEVKELQMTTARELMDLNADLKDALQSVLNRTDGPVYSYQWGLVHTLISNMENVISTADYTIRNGRTRGYNWKGNYDASLDKEEAG